MRNNNQVTTQPKESLRVKQLIQKFLDIRLYKNNFKRNGDSVIGRTSPFFFLDDTTIHEHILPTSINIPQKSINIQVSVNGKDGWFFNCGDDKHLFVDVFGHVRQNFDANGRLVVHNFDLDENKVIAITYVLVDCEKVKTWLEKVRKISDQTIRDTLKKISKNNLRIKLDDGIFIARKKNDPTDTVNLIISRELLVNNINCTHGYIQ